MADVVGTATVIITPDSSGFATALSGQMTGALGGINSSVNGVSGSLDAMAKKTEALGRSVSSTGTSMTRNLTLPIGFLGYKIAETASEFDNAIRTLAAVGEIDLNLDDKNSEINLLRESAIALGRDGKFGAVEVAEGFTELARAGVEANDVTKASVPIMQLATIENLDFAKSAESAINVTYGFGRSIDELDNVIDVLALTSNKSTTSMTDLVTAFRYAGPLAATAGLSFNETAAALGLLANAGFNASLGGTALRGAIARLAKPSADATEELQKMGFSVEEVIKETEQVDMTEVTKELRGLGLSAEATDAALAGFDGTAGASERTIQSLGLSIFDSEGKMRPLVEILTQMKDAGITAGQAMTIFGLRAGPGMLALLSQGPEKLAELTTELGAAGGTAEEMAGKILAGPTYAFQRLKNSATELAIAIGDAGFLDILADIAVRFTDMFRTMSEANPELLRTATIVALVAASVGPLLKVLGLMIGGWAKVLSLLAFITSGPLGLLVGALLAVAGALVLAWQNSEPFREAVMNLWMAFQDFLDPILEKITGRLDGLGGFFETVGRIIGDNLAPFVQDLATYLTSLRISFDEITEVENPVTRTLLAIYQGIGDIIDAVDPFIQALTGGFAAATGDAGGALEVFLAKMDASNLAPFARTIVDMGAQIGGVVGEIKNFFGALFDGGANSEATNGVLQRLRDNFGEAGGAVAGILDALDSLIVFVQTVVLPILGALATFFTDTLVPVLAVVIPAAIGIVVGAFGTLGTIIDGITAVLGPVASFLADNLVPILAALGGVFTTFGLASLFGTLASAAGTLAAALGPLGTVLSGLLYAFQAGGIVGVLGTAFNGIGAAAVAALGPVGIIAAAIAALVALFVVLWQRSEDFRVAIMNGLSSIGQAVTGVMDVFRGLFDVLVGIFTLDGERIFSGLTTAFEGLTRGVMSGINNMASATMDALGAAVDTILGALSNIPIIGPIFEGIRQNISGALDVLKGFFDILSGIFNWDWDQVRAGIETVFGGLMDMLTSFPETIGALFSDLGPKILPALQTLGSAIWDWLVTELPGLLVQGLSLAVQGLSALQSILWEGGIQIITWIGQGLQAGIQASVDWLKELPTFLINAVVGFFTGEDNGPGGGLGSAIGGWIEGAITAAWDFLSTNIPQWGATLLGILWTAWKFVMFELPARIVTEGVPALWDAIVQFGPAAAEAFGTFLGNIPGWIWDALVVIGPLVLRALTAIPEILGSWAGQLLTFILPILGNLPDAIWGTLQSLGQFLWDSLLAGLSKIPELIGWLIGVVIDLFIGLPLKIVDVLADIGFWIYENALVPAFTWLVENLPGIISGIITFFTELPGKIVEGIGNLGSWLYDNVFMPMAVWLVLNWPTIRDTVIGFFKELPGKIVEGIGNLGQWIHDNVLIPMAEWLVLNWPAIRDTITQFFKDLPGNIVDGIGNLGEWIWNNVFIPAKDWLVENIPTMLGAIVDFFEELPGKIGEALSGLASSIWETFKEVGGNILGGIAEGLGAAVDWVENIAKDIGNAISGWINDNIIIKLNEAIPNDIGPWDIEDNPIPLIPIAHDGGVVGSLGQTAMRAVKSDETMALLQRGEGILPVSVMKALGPAQFEALRSGAAIINQSTRGVSGPVVGSVRSTVMSTDQPAAGPAVQIDQLIVQVEATPDTTPEQAQAVGSAVGDAIAKTIRVKAAIATS